MIRETYADPVGPFLQEAVRAASLADLAWGPMDGVGAAAFLKTSRSRFDRLAPRLPRYKKAGLSYRYLRSELLEWLRRGRRARRRGPGRSPATATMAT